MFAAGIANAVESASHVVLTEAAHVAILTVRGGGQHVALESPMGCLDDN